MQNDLYDYLKGRYRDFIPTVTERIQSICESWLTALKSYTNSKHDFYMEIDYKTTGQQIYLSKIGFTLVKNYSRTKFDLIASEIEWDLKEKKELQKNYLALGALDSGASFEIQLELDPE